MAIRSPSLVELHAFLAVARNGSFRKAAEELHLTQAAVSRAVQRLEETLGVDVLERSGAGVRLTPAGVELRKRTGRHVDALEEAAIALGRRARAAAAAPVGGAEPRHPVAPAAAGGFPLRPPGSRARTAPVPSRRELPARRRGLVDRTEAPALAAAGGDRLPGRTRDRRGVRAFAGARHEDPAATAVAAPAVPLELPRQLGALGAGGGRGSCRRARAAPVSTWC